jgi:DNA ligase 1
LVEAFLRSLADEDAAAAFWLMGGGKPHGSPPKGKVREAAKKATGLPDWLMDECRRAVGESGEAWALIVADDAVDFRKPLTLAHLVTLATEIASAPPDCQEEALVRSWTGLTKDERVALNGALAGGFSHCRPAAVEGASALLMLTPQSLIQSLAEGWEPTAAFWNSLKGQGDNGSGECRKAGSGDPVPWPQAEPWESENPQGDPKDWAVQWIPRGPRCQLVRAGGKTWIWSEEGGLLNSQFPESLQWGERLEEGVIIEGEILGPEGTKDEVAEPWNRLGRKRTSAEAAAKRPCRFLPYDLLSSHEERCLDAPFRRRTELLRAKWGPFQEPLCLASWSDLQQIKVQGEAQGRLGLILTKWDEAGARSLWKNSPKLAQGVLVYARPSLPTAPTGGQSLYLDLTLALWDGDVLVAFASGVFQADHKEEAELDRAIREATIARHGPVREVRPALVFTFQYDRTIPSARHKGGVHSLGVKVLEWQRGALPSQASRWQDALDSPS